MTDVRVLLMPTPAEFGGALVDFFRTVAAVTDVRSQAVGPRWVFELGAAEEIAAEISRRAATGELYDLVERDLEDNAVAYQILFHGLLYAQHKFRDLAPFGFLLPDGLSSSDWFGDDRGEPLDEKDVKELDVIKGSIEKVFERLPGWLKKLMEVAMELLKITRGVV